MVEKKDNDLEDELAGFGHYEVHGTIDEETYCWKGCWGCYQFVAGKKFPYVFVKEAAEKLAVPRTTVRKLLDKGELEGEVFIQGRYTSSLPAPPKYHIERESVDELLQRRSNKISHFERR